MIRHLTLVLFLFTTCSSFTAIAQESRKQKKDTSLEQEFDKTNGNVSENSQDSTKRAKPRTGRKPGVWSCKNCVWLGAGAHYLLFQQKSPANVDALNYEAFGAPSIWGEFRVNLLGRVGLTAEYQAQNGADIKSTTLNLTNKKVQWTYSTVGFDYRFRSYFRLFGHIWLPRLLVAYQMHSMPFLKEEATNSYTIVPLQFNTLSVGGYFDILRSESWHFFLTNRLQVPVQSQTDIQVQQGVSFDGTIGAVYHFNKNVAWAIYWGGQYHSLKYKIETQEANYVLGTSKINTLIGFYF